MSRVISFFTKRYIWVSDRLKKSYRYIIIEWSLRGVFLGRCSSKLANFLKLLKIAAKFFTNTCDAVQFCKVSCFQPAVLPEKWNPSQVFSKEFAKIQEARKEARTRKQEILNNYFTKRINLALPLLPNYYHCLWIFFFWETAREVML